MKFSVSVFLLILDPFSLVKTVLSIDCYVSEDAAVSESQCQSQINRKTVNNDDELLSKIFGCIRNVVKELKSTCDQELFTKCVTIITELKDQTQLMAKGCGNSGDRQCEEADLEAKNTIGEVKDFIKTTHCVYCSSDLCNNQKPKNNPRLSSLAVCAPPAAAVFIIISILHILL